MPFPQCLSLSTLLALAISHISLIAGSAIPSVQPTSTGLYTNDTLSPTQTQNASGLSAADKCWSSWDAYSASSLSCPITTTATSKTTYTDTKTSVVIETYKLCDGHPRANVSAKEESTSRSTASQSGTAWTTITEVLPPSGIPEATVTTLVTSALTFFETACAESAAMPTCSIGVEECQDLMSMWTAGGYKRGKPPCTIPLSEDPCDDCRIYVPTVKLLYFPVTMTGDFCRGDYSTYTPTVPSGSPLPTVMTISNQTFTTGLAYLSYAGVSAIGGGDVNNNPRLCGSPLPAGILALPSSRLSTYRGHLAAMPQASLHPYSLNFGDLAPNPVPWDAWIGQEGCVTHQDYPECQTITQEAYRPWVVYPRELWEMPGADERWKKCGSDVFGIMDPPSSLVVADGIGMPTTPVVGGGMTTEGAMTGGSAGKPTVEPTETTARETGDAGHGASPSRSPVATVPQTSEIPEATRDPADADPEPKPSEEASAGSSDDPAQSNQPPTAITATFTFDPPAPTAGLGPMPSVATPDGPTDENAPDATSSQDDAIESSNPTTRSQKITPTDLGDETQPVEPTASLKGDPAMTAPGLSILASALSPLVSNLEPSMASAVSSVLSEVDSILQPGSSTNEQDSAATENVSSDHSPATGLLVDLGNTEYTAVRTSNHVVLGSATLSVGDETTMSGVPIQVFSSALLVDGTFAPLPNTGAAVSSTASTTESTELPPVVISSASYATASTEILPSITSVEASSSTSGRDASGDAAERASSSAGSCCKYRSNAILMLVVMVASILVLDL